MFKKILIANRGEIAVRIIRTCREMGIRTVAVYEISDRDSLHVRLADECVQLPGHQSFMEPETILAAARRVGADAIHPGYGFLAENAAFARACAAAGLTFIGPSPEAIAVMGDKRAARALAERVGAPVVPGYHGNAQDDDSFAAAAMQIGYPVMVKAAAGGGGKGMRLVHEAAALPAALAEARREAVAAFGVGDLLLERAIAPAHQVGVQIVADRYGNLVHLGEREGSIVQNNQKLVEEAPALCLSPEQRAALLATAVRLARLVEYQNVGTVEFLVDDAGQFYFSEIKARIQLEHTLTEMMTRIDLIREQIRLEAGEPLGYEQSDVTLKGWAMMCRVRAEDPARRYMPSPGHLRRVRLPGGPEVRVDTYLYCDSEVPSFYDPLIAKATVWAADRPACIDRLRRALEDLAIIGAPTNVPLLTAVLRSPAFVAGHYDTNFLRRTPDTKPATDIDQLQRDIAAVAAVLFARRHESFIPQQPERWATGWHRTSRQLG